MLTAAPVTDHPRLLFRAGDLPALRARMHDNNDVWVAFRDQVALPALKDWKRSRNAAGQLVEADGSIVPASEAYYSYAVPEDDTGAHTGNQPVFSEQYAMIFSFMALLTRDDPALAAQHAEYVTAAKECLFKVIDAASLGHPAADANGKYPPFRHPSFVHADRSFMQESFALTVDWIHETLTPLELAKIRKTFLLWAADTNAHYYYSPKNPNNLVNDPAILQLDKPSESVTRAEVRLGLNNHYANHLRQLALWAMALDPRHDVPSATAAAGVNDPAVATALTALGDTVGAGALTGFTTGAGGDSDWVY